MWGVLVGIYIIYVLYPFFEEWQLRRADRRRLACSVSRLAKQEKICRQIKLAPRQIAGPRIHRNEMSVLI